MNMQTILNALGFSREKSRPAYVDTFDRAKARLHTQLKPRADKFEDMIESMTAATTKKRRKKKGG